MLLEAFEKFLNHIDKYLQLIGLSLEPEDRDRTVFERHRYHWKYTAHQLSFNLNISLQIIWFIQGIVMGKSLLQITFILPCLTMCLLGDFKIISFVHNIHNIHDIIDSLRNILSIERPNEENNLGDSLKVWLMYLSAVYKTILMLIICGAGLFGIGPLIIMATYYYTTGTLRFFVPFLIWYPFDQLVLPNWFFVYFHQMISAWMAIFSVYGADCFFFICCTFIHIEFLFLHRDMQEIVEEDSWKLEPHYRNALFKKKIVQLVKRHQDLIRCIELVDSIYSKSTLFNVVTSSMVICAAGFNLMMLENYALMAPFTAFLGFGMIQIFFYCYYGDLVMRSSLAVSDAIYNSRWYEMGAAERKYLFIVLIRAQKPCKFTAYRFTDVNLGAFTRILSSSWSYFALLNQMYGD